MLLAAARLHGEEPRPPVEPDEGVFLVARPDIDGGPFWRSVVLILSHGEDGTLGVIVNRATELHLAEVLPQIESEDDPSPPLQFGGPVALQGLLCVFRSEEPPEGAHHVMEDVYYDGRLETLEHLLSQERGEDSMRLIVGHAGWAPGQLDAEILRGSWDLLEADAFTVFRKDLDLMWKELSGRARRVIARGSRPATFESGGGP